MSSTSIDDKLANYTGGINIYRSINNGNRTYKLADTPVGRIVFYEFGDGEYTQYRNLTNHDIMWSIKSTDDFREMIESKPVEVFTSERITGFTRTKIKIDCGTDGIYHLAEKSKSDGYLYEIPTTLLRCYPRKDYPDMKFVYTRYYIPTCRELDRLTLERLKTEEIVRFNGGYGHSVSGVSTIIDEVYKYVRDDIV